MIHPSVNSPTNMDEEESMLLEKEDEEETNVIHQLMKLKRSQWWIFVFISIFFLIFLISAQAVAVLLGRFYYGQGGNSKWISSLVQTVGFPILYLPLRLLPASSHPSSSSSCSFKTGLDIFFSWSCYWLRQSGILSMIWKFKEQEKLKKDAFVIVCSISKYIYCKFKINI
ncbi:probable purine permease 13 [Brassica napus]|uniref:probable purine permease 13 n=1 Tax=Brassica napus TaxID=3708 RepID=UPI000BBEBCEA|nr:probable purine permease 13 [Brassica napus]